MGSQITLSNKSKETIQKIAQLKNSTIGLPVEFSTSSSVESKLIIEFLRQKQQVNDKHCFLLESLYASLLNDLLQIFPVQKPKPAKQKPGWLSKFKFIMLGIAGTLYFGCEGFDGIAAILTLTTMPSLAIFALAFSFSILSIIVFYAFNLLEISRTLGINLKSTPKIIDIYLKEIQKIKELRKAVTNNFFQKNITEIQEDIMLLNMLEERFLMLDEGRKRLTKSLENPLLKFAKMTAACLAGALFFSGGFFAGQTVALAIAALFAVTASFGFWPVVLASVVVGLAALSIYWFAERPGVENLIGRWIGLDKDKIDKLCDNEAIQKEQKKLQDLKTNLENRCNDLTKLAHAEERILLLETKLKEQEKATPSKESLVENLKLSRLKKLGAPSEELLSLKDVNEAQIGQQSRFFQSRSAGDLQNAFAPRAPSFMSN